MMRIIYLLALLSGMALCARAQLPLDGKRYTDSLNNILSRPGPDSVKSRMNFLLSHYWSVLDTVKSKQYLEEGKRLSQKYPYLRALYFFYAAEFDSETNPALAEETYKKADQEISRYKTSEAYLFRARAWNNYSLLLQAKDDSKGMTDVLLHKAIPLALQAGDTGFVGVIYVNLGVVFGNNLQYDKAEAYYNQAIGLLKEIPSRATTLTIAYIKAAQNYVALEKYPQAKEMLIHAKVLIPPAAQSDHALQYYNSEAMYFIAVRKYEEALKSIDKGLALARILDQPYSTQTLLLQQYRTLFAQGKYERAKQVLLGLMQMKDLDYESAQNNINQYRFLSQTYAKLGQMDSAYFWNERYINLADSAHEIRLETELNDMEIKYRNIEKEKEIIALKAKNEQMLLSARNSRLLNWLLTSASLLLLIVAAFLLLYYRNHKKLAQQKELNHKQELKDISQRQQINTAQSMLTALEEERNRVARDLHDGLGGILAGIKINLSAFALNKGETNNTELQGIIGQLDYSSDELRRIAHNMMPEILLKLGLETSLKNLCESMMSEDLAVDFQCFWIKNTLSTQEQITIYRIVQELLTNVVKHAQATRILLQCAQNEGIFLITIEDDGRGFDESKMTGKQGIGLGNIRNRVAYLNGKMEISSKDGSAGTVINIELYVTP